MCDLVLGVEGPGVEELDSAEGVQHAVHLPPSVGKFTAPIVRVSVLGGSRSRYHHAMLLYQLSTFSFRPDQLAYPAQYLSAST